MKEDNAAPRFTFISAGVFWLIVIIVSAWFNIDEAKKNIDNNVLEASRSFFKEIVTTRQWNAQHGGVYVKITENTQPNPYLDVPDRDIETADGVKLTMINPAYMTRQISEIAKSNDDVLYHITSSNPIRPANKADVWEERVLSNFENGNEEAFGLVSYLELNYYRYMAPLFVNESCMKCHEKQGYKIGEVRGGISVSIPADNFISTYRAQFVSISIWHFVFLMLGWGGIYLFGKRIYLQYSTIHSTNEELKKIDSLRKLELKKNIKLNKELDNKVKERTSELEIAKEKISMFLRSEKEINEMKTRFINLIHHEFKTPLTVVLSSSEIIKVLSSNKQNCELSDHLSKINTAVKNMDKLLSYVQYFQQSNKMLKEFSPEKFDIIETINFIIKSRPEKYTDRQITFKHNGCQSFTFYSDKKLFEYIVREVITNALKFSPKNSVVNVVLDSGPESFLIIIKDDGDGIHGDDLPKIMDPFYKQADKIGIDSGLGLGLSIVKKYIEIMGGNIEITSKKCEGTTVTLNFNIK